MASSPGSLPMPVGLMRRIGPRRWFWWEAGGDTAFHGHLVEGTAETLYDGLAVAFRDGGKLVAYLTTTAESFDREEDAAAADNLVRLWRGEYDRNERLRAFIEQEARTRL